LSERAIHIGVLVSALALGVWLFGSHWQRTSAPARSASPGTASSPLAIIPPGSAFLLSVDVAQLRHAELGPLLAHRFGRIGSNAGDLTSLCGFDPLLALDQVALTVPSAGVSPVEHEDDFGIVATGRFSARQITRCASAAISRRGGDPVDSELGAFSSVRDRKADGGEVAARDGGPLIVSGGRYFRELVDAAEGRVATSEHEDPKDAEHVALRRTLGPGTIVATWLLPDGWFERFSGDDRARLSPLRALKALGARLDLDRELRVSVLLECADAASATEIATLVEQLRASLGALALDPTLSGAAQRITARADGARLWLNLALSPVELNAVLDLALGLDGSATPPSPPSIASSDGLRIPAH
jgi:hypothetical protein